MSFGREPVAFKTGTAYGWRDRWIFAYTKDYTIVLWSGRADGQFAEKRASAEQLIPLLRQVIARLPNPPSTTSQLRLPAIVPNHHLPRRLRHVGESKQTLTTPPPLKTNPNALAITAPLNNSNIDFYEGLQLSFHIQGGTPPYLYLLNGDMLKQTAEQTLTLRDTTLGSYQLLVIDANGDSSESYFTLTQKQEKTMTRQATWQ